MDDKKTINERPEKRWSRFEYQEKKKAIIRDLADVINRHGFDSHFNIPDFLLANVAVSAMFQFSQFKQKFEYWEFGKVIKKHEEWDGTTPHPFGCDESEEP